MSYLYLTTHFKQAYQDQHHNPENVAEESLLISKFNSRIPELFMMERITGSEAVAYRTCRRLIYNKV